MASSGISAACAANAGPIPSPSRWAQYPIICQLSTDGFAAYPEAVDLAFGPYVKYGTIIKEYKNANMIYTPSEMVGTKRTGIRNIDNRNARTITTAHVERLNGTQRFL